MASLDAGGKVPVSQIPALGDLNYQGTWNATTNIPTLVSSAGTKGYYYVVATAGTTNLNGITDWQIGDWAVFNGSVWQKIDNTDAVTSVNGYTGTVVLTAADVSAIPYTGATGAVDLNAKTLVNVANLGINTTTVPTIRFRAVGDNNSGSRIAMRGYSSDANSSSIRVSKFRGTSGAPQAPISGDSLGKFELAGYGTTASEAYPQVSLEGVTTEVWGATARGAKALIKVTPNTTITQVTAVTIDQDKSVTLAGALAVTGATTLATSLSGLAKLTSGVVSTATSGTDYAPATSGSSILYGNGVGGFSNVTIGSGVAFAGGTLSATGSGGTVTSVTGTAPVVSSGGATPAISMAAATTSVSGYLTSTDWTTFNNKSNTNGTVTSVAAITLGTTGTDLSSTVATGTTTPVITLQVPTASATNRGALSSTDWSTFNGKQPAGSYLTASTGVTTFAGNSTGLTPTTATSGAVTLGGTLVASNGGTGLAGTLTGISYMNGTSAHTVATTAQALTLIGTLPIANGGTNSTATPTAGGAVYGTGTAYAITAAGTTGQFLTSNGASAPTWATPSSTYTRTSFTATAGQTVFTVTYTVGLAEVYLNGVLLNSTDYTASSGTSITLATAAALNDIVEVIAFTSASVLSFSSPPAIGNTAPNTGAFTSLTATSNAVGSVTAKTGGLTAVTAVAGSLTLATGGVTLASQVMAAGSVWRIVAYGTYAASSSASARTLTMDCVWGATALTSVTTGNVLAVTAQTTAWWVELEVTGSSATAAWCTGILSAQITSATIPLNYIATAASVTGLTTTSTLDFKVGQTGTAVAGDTINVHSVIIERVK